MADITNLFKATVKTVKARQKAQGITGGSDKHPILGHAKTKTEFATKAKNVVNGITKLRDFLVNHRKDYINACSMLTSEVSKMTDGERDQIDSDAQIFMRTCSDAIKSLKTEASSAKVLPQVKEHREVVFNLMETYLKGVCKLYSEQRAVRVKRVVDRKRISRLEPEKKKFKTSFDTDETKEKGSIEDPENKTGSSGEIAGAQNEMAMDDLPSPNLEEEDLSPEEAQMFEQENEQLFQEMNSIVDEVRQIEGKVVEISRLQEIFTDKIMEQDRDIDRIAETAVGTTENIKEANEEIREAMKNNAGLRVWILFFLIVCSLSLLFLDWYNA